MLATTVFADEKQAEIEQTLFYSLRCVSCNGQVLAESQAPLALDMKKFIRERLAYNMEPEAIKAELVTAYGNNILLDPFKNKHSFILWWLPYILIVLLVILFIIRKRYFFAKK